MLAGRTAVGALGRFGALGCSTSMAAITAAAAGWVAALVVVSFAFGSGFFTPSDRCTAARVACAGRFAAAAAAAAGVVLGTASSRRLSRRLVAFRRALRLGRRWACGGAGVRAAPASESESDELDDESESESESELLLLLLLEDELSEELREGESSETARGRPAGGAEAGAGPSP